MTRATSPRTRTSFLIIELALASWVTPRKTLASPCLDLPYHHRIDLRLHHLSSLRQQHLPALPPTLRTRCSLLLSVSTHSGMRPRSTASSSLRIWRRCAPICGLFWPIRSPFRPSLLSSWRSTSHLRLHRSDVQGSSLTLSVFILPVGTLDFLLGGGGGIFCSSTLFLCFVYRSFSSVILVLVVYSIVSCFAYWLCVVFSITCSDR